MGEPAARRFVLGFLVVDEEDSIHTTLEALRRERRAVVCEGQEPSAHKRNIERHLRAVYDKPPPLAR